MMSAAQALAHFVARDQITELRALHVSTPSYRKPHTVAGFFDSAHLDDLVKEAAKLTAQAKGVYFIPNPLNADLLARRRNRVDVADSGSLAADKDVLRRKWLLIDADPVRLEGISATDPEKAKALDVSKAVCDYLIGIGWPAPICADSGNGYHQFFRIDLPAEDGELVKRVLAGLARRFDTEAVKIDPKVFNPARIVKLPGTWARKGENLPERPHRLAGLLEVPPHIETVPRELLEKVAALAPKPEPRRPSNTAAVEWSGDRSRILGRAAKYLEKIPPAVSGEQGHNQTFKAACALVLGFGCTVDEALPLLRTYSDRCQPPWSDRELLHKLQDADKQTGERGYLLSGAKPAAKKHTPTAHCGAPAPEQPIERKKRKRLALAPYHPFPVDELPVPLSLYVRQAASALGCDPAYIALPALAVVASLIGNTRTIRLKHGWEEPSVIWSAIVGDSGTLKSPAYHKAVTYVYRLQNRLRAKYDQQLAQYQEEQEKWKEAKKRAKDGDGGDPGPEPAKPILHRVVCSDTTIEKLAEMLEDNPRGLLVARDELAGWIGSFSRYKGKAGGTDLPNWLEMNRAGTVIIDRKIGLRTHYYIPRAAASVTGGIQPGVLVRALSQEFLDAGLAARVLMAMPPRMPKRWSETEVLPEVEDAYHGLLDKLQALQMGEDQDGEPAPYVLRLSPDAKACWVAFYNQWAQEQAAAEGELAAALSKLEAYAARFALLHHVVAHVARGLDDRCDVGQDSIIAGITLARWFANEARRIYSTLTESEEERAERRLVEFIKGRGGRITARQLMRSNNRKYPTVGFAELALDHLVEEDQGQWCDTETTDQGGRPTRYFYLCMTHDTTDTTHDQGDVDGDELPDTTADTTPRNGQNSNALDGSVGFVMRHAETRDPVVQGNGRHGGSVMQDEVLSGEDGHHGDAWEG